jgi:hypothetical protein
MGDDGEIKIAQAEIPPGLLSMLFSKGFGARRRWIAGCENRGEAALSNNAAFVFSRAGNFSRHNLSEAGAKLPQRPENRVSFPEGMAVLP